MVDRLKALKIKESNFFLFSKPSMLSTLCNTLVCCLIIFVCICLNCVFLLIGSRNTDATPSPLGRRGRVFTLTLTISEAEINIISLGFPINIKRPFSISRLLLLMYRCSTNLFIYSIGDVSKRARMISAVCVRSGAFILYCIV